MTQRRSEGLVVRLRRGNKESRGVRALKGLDVHMEAGVSSSGTSGVDEDLGVALPELEFVCVSRNEDIDVHAALSDGQGLLISPRNDLSAVQVAEEARCQLRADR